MKATQKWLTNALGLVAQARLKASDLFLSRKEKKEGLVVTLRRMKCTTFYTLCPQYSLALHEIGSSSVVLYECILRGRKEREQSQSWQHKLPEKSRVKSQRATATQRTTLQRQWRAFAFFLGSAQRLSVLYLSQIAAIGWQHVMDDLRSTATEKSHLEASKDTDLWAST